MNHDDEMVLDYLGKYPNSFVSVMEVCKRAADRRRFAQQPDWARPILARLAQASVLECNASGQYRIKPKPEEKGPAEDEQVLGPGEGVLPDPEPPQSADDTPFSKMPTVDQPQPEPESKAA